jgi:repressor LexA
MKRLTDRQEAVLRFVSSFRDKTGRTPTGPEVADHFGFRHFSSAYQHLASLEKKGFIEILRFGNRRPMGLRLTSLARHLLATEWPLLGSIPAGDLTEVLDDDAETVRRLEDLVPVLKHGDYFLRVSGDSMIDVGIHPGHLVILRPSLQPQNGDIAATWVDGEGATLKFVFIQGDTVRLQPANKRYSARTYPSDQVRFQGVLVGKVDVQVFRR